MNFVKIKFDFFIELAFPIQKFNQNSDNQLSQKCFSKLDDLVDSIKINDDLRKEVITELRSVSKSIKDLDKSELSL